VLRAAQRRTLKPELQRALSSEVRRRSARER